MSAMNARQAVPQEDSIDLSTWVHDANNILSAMRLSVAIAQRQSPDALQGRLETLDTDIDLLIEMVSGLCAAQQGDR